MRSRKSFMRGFSTKIDFHFAMKNSDAIISPLNWMCLWIEMAAWVNVFNKETRAARLVIAALKFHQRHENSFRLFFVGVK